ncbi:F-box protein At1g67130-like [Chenopodium quinoa]|uniref:F-box protein At1g67130-like n=1 Tax=Chenopodium quinoa TaxID=63459 RepID=UPI000B78D494|nr:F-box protein At1g67130-like [Chenopodium quinoa]
MNNTLPDHLIFEKILPKLPVKSLLRFKSVSKLWLSTISSHKFVQTHLKFSSSRLQALLIHGLYLYEGSSVLSFDECNNFKDSNLISYYPSQRGLESYVIGSSNGLVGLFGVDYTLYIWNPSTNQCHDVSFPDFDLIHCNLPDEITGMVFGYVSSIDDYRKWIEMPSIDASNENYGFRIGSDGDRGVVVDDTLYWTPVKLSLLGGEEAHIAGLNLVNGEMKKFPLMNLLVGYAEDVRVFRLNGCLSMCCYKYMKGDNSSCVTVSSFNLGNVEFLWLFETGNYLVLENTLNLLMLHDPSHVALDQEEESTGIRSIHAQNFIGGAWGYAESLISPFGTTLSDGNE